MKKLLFVLACFMFITCVKAELLTPDDVRNGFLNSPLIKFANEDNPDDEKIDVEIKTDTSTFVIKAGNEEFKSYPFTSEYIIFTDERELTKENAESQLTDMMMMASFLDGIINKSGFDSSRLKDFPENFNPDYETYGLVMSGEPYTFTDEEGTSSGTFIREFKISFDTEKIRALVDRVGLEEESNLDELIPVITVKEKDKTSVSLNVYVDDGGKQHFCYLQRATEENGEYENVFDLGFDCTVDRDLMVVDDELETNKTYYYRAIVVGGTKYSNVIPVFVGEQKPAPKPDKIVNPNTGVANIVIPLVIICLFGIGSLVLMYKNKGMKL